MCTSNRMFNIYHLHIYINIDKKNIHSFKTFENIITVPHNLFIFQVKNVKIHGLSIFFKILKLEFKPNSQKSWFFLYVRFENLIQGPITYLHLTEKKAQRKITLTFYESFCRHWKFNRLLTIYHQKIFLFYVTQKWFTLDTSNFRQMFTCIIIFLNMLTLFKLFIDPKHF